MALISENKFFGLWQGPVDHNASSVVNAIYDTSDPVNFAVIGCTVFIQTSSKGLLPEVNFIDNMAQEFLFYGILVGGDIDGIYQVSGGTLLTNDEGPDVVALSGDGVKVCTQEPAWLFYSNTGVEIGYDIPVDIQREGILP